MFFEQALLELKPKAEWSIKGETCYENLTWIDKKQSKPTETEINDKIAELQAEYNSKKYQRDRQYPELGEQFDLLFKDIDSGKVSKDGGFYKAIKAVKDKHPKPSE